MPFSPHQPTNGEDINMIDLFVQTVDRGDGVLSTDCSSEAAVPSNQEQDLDRRLAAVFGHRYGQGQICNHQPYESGYAVSKGSHSAYK